MAKKAKIAKKMTKVTPDIKNITHRHHLIAYLAASGMTMRDIAFRTDLSSVRVQQLLKMPTLKSLVEDERQKLYGDNIEQQIKQEVPEALRVVSDMMTDREAKHGTRLSAAKDLLDRAIGRPIQRVEDVGSSIKDLFEVLDRAGISLNKKEDDVIDVNSSEARNDALVDEAVIVKDEEEKVEDSVAVNAWMDNFIKGDTNELHGKTTGDTAKIQASGADEGSAAQSTPRASGVDGHSGGAIAEREIAEIESDMQRNNSKE